MYNKNDSVTVRITDIGNNGEGIGKIEGYTLFVKDAVIGDTVKVSIMKAKKNYAYAHLDEIISPSDKRIEPMCPKAKACGGCQLQALKYGEQLKYKTDKVKNDLIRIGGFDAKLIDSVMEPIIGMDGAFPVRYRGKAQFPVGRDREGNIVTGFYAGHSHSIIPIDDCVIGAKEYAKITGIIRDHMKHYDIAPYDENSGTGLVRHILIRKGYKTGELMVCLVLNRGKSSNGIYLTGQDELIKELGKINNMTSVSVDLNTHNTNVIMGDETYTIWGSDVIHDVIETVDADERAITYSISPLSFYQVNPKQTDRLYSKVLQYAGLTGKETVWDLYCGTGTISLFLAGSAAHVYGVEIVPDAIKDAIRNAKDNGIDNVSFYVGKAEDIYLDGSDTASEGGILLSDRPDVIVVDPPRKGCDQVLINTMLSVAPGKIVYVSCDPATLSRDLKLLCDGGYELKAVTPTDMFPHCVHIENCCLLTRTSA